MQAQIHFLQLHGARPMLIYHFSLWVDHQSTSYRECATSGHSLLLLTFGHTWIPILDLFRHAGLHDGAWPGNRSSMHGCLWPPYTNIRDQNLCLIQQFYPQYASLRARKTLIRHLHRPQRSNIEAPEQYPCRRSIWIWRCRFRINWPEYYYISPCHMKTTPPQFLYRLYFEFPDQFKLIYTNKRAIGVR